MSAWRKAIVAVVLGLGAAGVSSAAAQTTAQYGFHLPHWHRPWTQQVVNNRCGPGYTRQTYQGQTLCIRCKDGYHYMWFSATGGNDKRLACVQCKPGYSYARSVSGKNLCVRCPAGYVFIAVQGRDTCLRR